MRGSGFALFALLLLTQPALAQNNSRGRSASRAPTTAVRSELAAVLLNAKRYAEAAREYQALVRRAPANDEYRWGLARALAWGNRPREAERELRYLKVRKPRNYEIDDLLRSVRESFQPTSGEAAGWVAEQPRYQPYRLALARALVQEGNARAALPHYEILIANNNSPVIRREVIDAQIAAGDYGRAADRLRITVLRMPGDSSSRHSLARLLTAAGDYDDALAHYDTLVAWYRAGVLLLERAQLQTVRRNFAAAEADATASLYVRQTADAYLLLSMLHLRRGNHAQARFHLDRSRLLAPDPRTYDALNAQLAREERPIIAYLPGWDEGAAWDGRSSALYDNEGLLYTTVGVRRVAELPRRFTASIDLELMRIAEPAPGLRSGLAGGAISGALAHVFDYGPLLVRLGARGGFSYQGERGLPTVGLAVTAWYNAWAISLQHAREPAYPTLLSAAAIGVPGTDDDPLIERSTSVSLGGPIGPIDLALHGQRAEISDGNERSTLQAVLRVRLSPNVAALGSVVSIGFAERSDIYWDPLEYVSGNAGLEVGTRQSLGLSAALRLLAGPARSVEEVRLSRFRTDDVESRALQLTGGAELSYRSEAGEVGAAVTYGNGRAGDYHRLEATLFVRRK